METFFVYLFKTCILLSIFHVVYFLLLKTNTFFIAKRYFFIFGILISLLLPLYKFTTFIYIDNIDLNITSTNNLEPINTSTNNLESINTPKKPTIYNPIFINWWTIGSVIYSLGAFIFFSSFCLQLLSLKKLLTHNQCRKENGFNFIEVTKDIAPFSFLKFIVFNPTLHSNKELEMILTHEKIHAKQHHTIDILLSNLFLVFQWINPIAWLYKKSIEQNLEFIVDHEVVKTSFSKKVYQLALINISSNSYYGITNNFYQSLIKKRIIMLNKKPSEKRNLLKFGAVLPLLSLFFWSFNTEEISLYHNQNSNNYLGISNTQSGDLKIEVRNDYTPKELNHLKKSLKNTYHINLKINTLEFNKGKISKINLSIEDDYNYSSSYSDAETKNSKPSFVILIKQDDKKKILDVDFITLHKGVSYEQQARMHKISETLSKLGQNPIFYINNKFYKKEEVIDQAFIVTSKIKIFPPIEALKKYGEIAKDGLLVLETSKKVKDISDAYQIFKKEKPFIGEYIEITSQKKPVYSLFITQQN